MTNFTTFGFKPLILRSSYESKNSPCIYLCRWNENDIVEIHTSDTLYDHYKDTNLFDDNEKLQHFSSNSLPMGLYLSAYLDVSDDDAFLNQDFELDNFTIRRIQ